jgi:thioredoxin 1
MIKKSILLLIIAAMLSPSCEKKAEANPEKLDNRATQPPSLSAKDNSSTNEAIAENSPQSETRVTFIELGSVNCIPCKKMQPVIKTIEEKYPEQVKVIFYDVWTKEGQPYAKQYKIRVIPTQVFQDSKGNEFFRHEGFFPLSEIEKILQQQGVQ